MTNSTHRCSRTHCWRRADAVHVVDAISGRYPHGQIEVKFSCPLHDLGGYWIWLRRLEGDPESWRAHLLEKDWGGRAVDALDELGLLGQQPSIPARSESATTRRTT